MPDSSPMAGAAMAFFIYEDKDAYWRWYLLGASHRRIAQSAEGFHDKEDCRDEIALVKASAHLPVYEV
jgi:uncharacterized protein YegP (UPF0339 family)